jgi:hypothetical protein
MVKGSGTRLIRVMNPMNIVSCVYPVGTYLPFTRVDRHVNKFLLELNDRDDCEFSQIQ